MKEIFALLKYTAILAVSLFFASCTVSHPSNQHQDISMSSASGDDNNVIVIYNQTCEGYDVNAIMSKEVFDEQGGDATFHFIKNDEHIIAICKDFHFITDESLMASDTIHLDYIAPKEEEHLSAESPFYFKDMDFDGEKELVITELHGGYYGSNSYNVFKVNGEGHATYLSEAPFVIDGEKICNRWAMYIPDEESVRFEYTSAGEIVRSLVYKAQKDSCGNKKFCLVTSTL